MLRIILFAIALTISLIGCAQTSTGVFVNGAEVQADYLQLLEQYYQTKVQKGRYWYDPYCGLWGMEGGSALGVMLPNLQFGGPLKSDASNGKTGIFINGRQINATERVQWEQLVGRITPDRYLLDAYGNVMTESGVYQLNLLQVAASQQTPAAGYNDQGVYHDGNGNTFYRNWYTDTGSGSSSDGFFYVIGEDFSYSSY